MKSSLESAGTLTRVTLLLLPLLLMFLALEVAVRMMRPSIDLLGRTGVRMTENPMSSWASSDPYAAYLARPGDYAGGKTVNRYGFISTPEIDRNKPEGRTRIVFFGGSSTAGTGRNLRDEETWPWQVVERLNSKPGRDVDFINAALGGYSTWESFGRLWSALRFFAPDIIVVYHGWNEMYYFNEIASDPLRWRRTEDGSWSVEQRGYFPLTAPHPVDRLLWWSQILVRVRLRLVNRTSDGEAGTSNADRSQLLADFNEEGLVLFRDNLRLMRMVAESFGAGMFVAKQATLITPFTSPEDRLRARYEFHGFDYDAHVAAFEGVYQVIDAEFLADKVIDVTELSGISELFFDHIHPTPTGSAEIARIVAEALEDRYFNERR